MKNLTILFALICLLFASSTMAQSRSNRQVKTVKPTQQSTQVKKISMLTFEHLTDQVMEDDDNLYFLENDDFGPNQIVCINKKTGTKTTMFANADESRKQMIHFIASDGKNFYYLQDKHGICLYDGNSLNTSKIIYKYGEDATGADLKMDNAKAIVFSPNGRYMAYLGLPTIVIDRQNNYQVIKSIDESHVSGVVLDDGTLIAAKNFDFHVIPPGGDLFIAPDAASKSRNMKEWRDGKNDMAGQKGEFRQMYYYQSTGELIMAKGNALIAFNIATHSWRLIQQFGEETEIKAFGYNGHNAIILTNNYEQSIGIFKTGDLSQPPVFMKKINTNFKDQWGSMITIDGIDLRRIYTGQNGNYYLKKGDYDWLIFNPDGIKDITGYIGVQKSFKK